MKNFKKISYMFLLTGVLFLVDYLPASATTFKELVDNVTGDLAKSFVRLIFALAFIFFFWGVVQYTLMPGVESKDKGKGYMIWGLIALTLMFSVYGIISVLQKTIFN